MNRIRRIVVQSAFAAGGVGLLSGAGLLAPRFALAGASRNAFEAGTLEEALKAAIGTTETIETDAISIKVPEIAENGAVVPVTVSATLDDVSAITIFVEHNPKPLISTYTIPEGTEVYVSTRVKMNKTSRLIAVVQSRDRFYSATKSIKVTIGGCGG